MGALTAVGQGQGEVTGRRIRKFFALLWGGGWGALMYWASAGGGSLSFSLHRPSWCVCAVVQALVLPFLLCVYLFSCSVCFILLFNLSQLLSVLPVFGTAPTVRFGKWTAFIEHFYPKCSTINAS